MPVTVQLPSDCAPSLRIDGRLTVWIGSLVVLSTLNVGIWFWIAGTASLHTPYTQVQLVLSGIYVGVCWFRSLFPRVDLERLCLWDTWLSAILLGRTAATIAEVCFAVQCVLFVERLSLIAGTPQVSMGAEALVPLVLLAEVGCWYAVLSLNHIGHAFEESLWAVLMLYLSVALGTAAAATGGPLQWILLAGCLIYGVGAAVTIAFDVPMYVRRWRLGAPRTYLTLTVGLRDSHRRRHPTLSWEVWREEVPWMTLYFSFGVWTSLGMILL